jgi:hypothetical protein
MKPFIFLLFAFFVCLSCQRPECVNTNEVLAQNYYDTEAYKKELSQLIRNSPSQVDYWLDMYVKKGSNEFLDVHVQSDAICAEAHILVTDWTKLQAIKETGGLGYHGARLEGLQFDIVQDSLHTQFIYKDIESIID